jgi:putative copper export protein
MLHNVLSTKGDAPVTTASQLARRYEHVTVHLAACLSTNVPHMHLTHKCVMTVKQHHHAYDNKQNKIVAQTQAANSLPKNVVLIQLHHAILVARMNNQLPATHTTLVLCNNVAHYNGN